VDSEIILTIITVNYNSGSVLPTLLSGVARLLQAFPVIEHVVVDGGSTDDSVNLLVDYCETYSRARFVSERDLGIFDAMNKGVRIARGRYVIHLNSDDYAVNMHEWRRALSILASEDADLLVADVPIVSEGRLVRVLRARPDSEFHLKFGYHYPHQGTFIRCDLFQRFGPYDLAAGYTADKVFFYRLIDCRASLKIISLACPISVQVAGGVSSASAFTPLRTLFRTAFGAASRTYLAPKRRAVLNLIYKARGRLRFESEKSAIEYSL
jgi:glycosyltransferase involved in cell wall biosynthesis